MSKVEKFLHKTVPEMIDLFVTPLVTVLVTAFATFLVIGPIFSVLENWVLAGATWLVTKTGGIASMVIGSLLTIVYEAMGQPLGIATVLIAVPVATIVLIVVSLMTQKENN